MKMTSRLITTITFLALLLVPGLSFSQAQGKKEEKLNGKCTESSVKGDYGYSFNGTVAGFGSIAAAGRVVSDGRGNLSGSYTQSLSGVIIEGNFVGTYAVDSDCTVSATLTGAIAPSSWSATLKGVIVNKGEELLLVGTDSGTVITGIAKKQ
ncbi:MAG TPA: hypothetical protein VD966_14890 [Pyrinomonadaceae bacterium]|nr:hypothetical protein [Pyrinomonadaceae bacterium]